MLILSQGLYFALTGIWPLINMASFEGVTGPKTDDWLVQTVGGLALLIGCALLFGLRRAVVTAETRFLAAGAAVVFGAADLVFGLSGRISSIYLADAAIQICIAIGLLLAW